MFEAKEPLEAQIAQWRAYLRRRQAISPADVEELEDHLRGQVAALIAAGLAPDEAFLVAVKRMGALDAISNEFAREHSERLWKQLVAAPAATGEASARARRETIVVFALAILAAMAVKLPELFGVSLGSDDDLPFYLRNFSLFVFPLLAGYFVWKRGLSVRYVGTAGGGVRRGHPVRECLSVRAQQPHGGADSPASADRPLAGRRDRLRGRPLGTDGRTDGLRQVLRRAVHLLRADRAGRWRADRLHGRHVRGDSWSLPSHSSPASARG